MKMQIYGIAILLLFVVAVFALYGWSEEHFSQMPATLPVVQQTLPNTPPPFTPAVQAQLAASHGFQYLVSYTATGFQPQTLTVKKGETVRFTNNSPEQLWIASKGIGEYNVYPGTSDCGGSALDTCNALQPKEFWEFTFTESGAWSYQNNLDQKMTGVITVQ